MSQVSVNVVRYLWESKRIGHHVVSCVLRTLNVHNGSQTGYCQFFIFLIFLFINVSMVAEAARSRRKPRWLLNTNVCFGAAIRFVMFHLNLFIFNICDTNRMKHLQHDCDLWVTRHLPAVMLSLTYLPKKERKKCSKQSYRCIWLLAL